jgi:hypothetical protein
MASSLSVAIASDQSPLPVSGAGSGSIATAKVSVTTGNITIAAARAGRFAITIEIVGTVADVYIGNTGVTTATGFRLKGVDGQSITIPTSAAIFGTVSAGTQIVHVLETF